MYEIKYMGLMGILYWWEAYSCANLKNNELQYYIHHPLSWSNSDNFFLACNQYPFCSRSGLLGKIVHAGRNAYDSAL